MGIYNNIIIAKIMLYYNGINNTEKRVSNYTAIGVAIISNCNSISTQRIVQ